MSYDIETTLPLVVCKYATSWVQQLCKDTTNFISIQEQFGKRKNLEMIFFLSVKPLFKSMLTLHY